MLARIADLRLCAFMFLSPYVLGPLCPCAFMPAPLCLRPYACALMSARLSTASFCLHPYAGFRSEIVW